MVVVDVIAAKQDPVTFRDLDSAGLPSGIEAVDVVRPDAVILDTNILTVAFDADLAVVMNVAVVYATAGPDADPGAGVQSHLAILDVPSDTLAGVDCALLRSARKLLDRQIAYRYVGCRTFEGKERGCRLELAVCRVVDEIGLAASVVDIEFSAREGVLAHHSGQRPVVQKQRLGLIAGGGAGQALAMLGTAPELAARHPIAPFTPGTGQQPAAIQNGTAFAVEALLRPRPIACAL